MNDRFPPAAFQREDESSDDEFYQMPRLVNHIDDAAIAAVTEAYRAFFLEDEGEYLDLMSSWVSHFPPEMEEARLVGLGMNLFELNQNERLTSYLVQDLNREPHLPFEAARFDGAMICVSVQYLTRSVEVFAEIGRVLKPGAPLVVTFSNRCFPTKAVRIWRETDDDHHGHLVQAYLDFSGTFEPAQSFDLSPQVTFLGIPEDAALRAQVASGQIHTDPLYVVIAHRKLDS